MKLAVLLALSLFVCPLFAADPTLDAFVEARMKEDRAPGFVLGYFKGDETVVHPYGYADLENQLPMQADSSFRLASITKTFTAVAVLQLAEAGKINLDDEIQKYVPYFPRKPFPVTIRQLLGHLGGISHYRNRAYEQHIKEKKTIRETIEIFANFDLIAEPGTKYNYSTYGYALLAAAIESASGQTYPAYMREHIFAPLGMTSTREDDPIAIIPKRVRGYQVLGGEVVNSEFVNISSRVGGGATRSTVPDLLRFARGLMNGKLISKSSMELMFTTQHTRDGKLTDYGLGCVPLPLAGAVDTNGRFGVMNDGGQQETRTFIMFFPGRDAGFATAMNFEFNTDDALIQRMAQTLFGEPLDLAPVSVDGKDDATLRAMQHVFTLGVADREAHPSKRYSDAEVRKALTDFAAIIDGKAPANDEPLLVFGRAMADALQSDPQTPSRGAVAFFNDYAKLHKMKLPPAIETRLARWNVDWNAATPPAVRSVVITADADFTRIGRQLRESFAGRSVIPDFARRFASAAEKLVLTNDLARANEAASIAAELYPASAAAQFALALPKLSNTDDARKLIRRAAELDASVANPNRLNGLAYSLANAKRVADGITILRIATELHPRIANLFDSLGELLLLAGDRDAARLAYQRALALDPTAKNAQEVLKTLEK
jgi:CubicO group peptidase (beta-lactamase class C family)/tetratricopeptide (TPR) repeat protein